MMIHSLMLATLVAKAIAVTNAAAQIDAAIIAKGGSTVGGLTNAPAAIAALPSGGGVSYPVDWKNDGKTHIWIRTLKPNVNLLLRELYLYKQPYQYAQIDYGDGTTNLIQVGWTGQAYFNTNHVYAAKGDYEIVISDYDSMKYGGPMFRKTDEGTYSTPSPKYHDSLTSVIQMEFAKVTEMNSLSNGQCLNNLIAVKFDDDCTFTKASQHCFSYCKNLNTVIFPDTVTEIVTYAFYDCNNLENLIPNKYTTYENQCFGNCFMLENIDMSDATSIGTGAFDTMGISNAVINVASIPNGTIRQCYNVRTIEIGENCTSIGTYSCTVVPLLKHLVCRATTPPTAGTGFMQSFPSAAKVYVPYSSDHSILTAYKAATNWSLRANQMYELNEDGTIPEEE